jgi:hypothetical protein
LFFEVSGLFFLICHESPKLDPSLEISPRFACGQYIHTYLLTFMHLPILVCCGYLLWKLLWVVWQSSHAHLSLSLSFSLSWALPICYLVHWLFGLVGGLPLWEHSSQSSSSSCFSLNVSLVERIGDSNRQKDFLALSQNESCLGPHYHKWVLLQVHLPHPKGVLG